MKAGMESVPDLCEIMGGRTHIGPVFFTNSESHVSKIPTNTGITDYRAGFASPEIQW